MPDAAPTGGPAGPLPVAIMIGQLGQGGSERQLYLFLARCDRSRFAPTLYVSGELGFWEAPIRALGVPIVLLTGGRLRKLLRFRAATDRQRPVAFFSWSSYTNPYALAFAGRRTQRIGSFRNDLFSDLPARHRAAWAWASTAGLATAVCNSRETAAALAARGMGERTIYVPNGVEIAAREEAAAWRQHWRARLGLAASDVLVVGVGRLTPQKCFTRFVDVVAALPRTAPVRAAIAGRDFGCLPALEEQIGRLGLAGTIALVGPIPEARALIGAADVFLLTSDHEGMPNVVLEAMSLGVPCVATRVNAIADLVRHGETGFVAGFDAGELAARVLHLVRDGALRRRMGEAGRRAVEQAHDADRMAEALWRLCEPVPSVRAARRPPLPSGREADMTVR